MYQNRRFEKAAMDVAGETTGKKDPMVRPF